VAVPVHLVGSVPLATASHVFETACAQLGDLIKRVPDGETGGRLGFISWANSQIGSAGGLEVDPDHAGPPWLGGKVYKVKPGTRPSQIDFSQNIYADVAIQSYGEFKRLRAEGKIPASIRFQVSLPTAIGVIFSSTSPASRPTVWTAYERHLIRDVEKILAHIPHDELAIQWDVATEIDRILEFPEVAIDYSMQALVDSIARLCDPVADAVEMGVHLCYGDPGHKHIIEPRDTALMVQLTNMLSRTVRRRIDWVHMPVPKERDDDAYFEPLRRLELANSVEIFLGLVHRTDGIEGAARRISTAKKFIPTFGVATECGWGRRPPETIPDLVELHRAVAELAAKPC